MASSVIGMPLGLKTDERSDPWDRAAQDGPIIVCPLDSTNYKAGVNSVAIGDLEYRGHGRLASRQCEIFGQDPRSGLLIRFRFWAFIVGSHEVNLFVGRHPQRLEVAQADMRQFVQQGKDITVQAVPTTGQSDNWCAVVKAHGRAIKLGGLEREEVHQDHPTVCEPHLEIGEISWIVDAVDQIGGKFRAASRSKVSNLSVLSDLTNTGQPCGLLRGERFFCV